MNPLENRILAELAVGPRPEGDGWGWLYRVFDYCSERIPFLGRLVCAYFAPSSCELARDRFGFRVLGVPLFGRVIPTGGVEIRRRTGARMAPYTLRGTSKGAAREFYYRACVFEALHLPFCLSLFALAGHRAASGRTEDAITEVVLNLLVNVYPILHHRHTRARIVSVLARRA